MSSVGVTGIRSKIITDISAMVDLVREVTDVPVAIGFGISTPEQSKKWHLNQMVPSLVVQLLRLLKNMEKMRHNM